MLNEADLEDELRDKIWAECVMNVTYLSNIISTKSSSNIPFELLYGEKPILHKNLKIFGEVGVVTTKYKNTGQVKQPRNNLNVCWLHGASLKRCL
jgi:hypothetical protein